MWCHQRRWAESSIETPLWEINNDIRECPHSQIAWLFTFPLLISLPSRTIWWLFAPFLRETWFIKTKYSIQQVKVHWYRIYKMKIICYFWIPNYRKIMCILLTTGGLCAYHWPQEDYVHIIIVYFICCWYHLVLFSSNDTLTFFLNSCDFQHWWGDWENTEEPHSTNWRL